MKCKLTDDVRILSGSWLKVLAMVSMVSDHAACCLLRYEEAFTEPLFTAYGRTVSWCFLLRCVGRLAFPLFAFLVVEGFVHTRSVRRYGLHLLLFALLSVVPWHLARYGCPFSLRSQNVLFTLLLGVCALEAVRRQEAGRLAGGTLAAVLLGLMGVASSFRTDYGVYGIGLILSLYVLRRRPALQAAVGLALLPLMRWAAVLAFIPINMYNGHRGFISGRAAKYAFYAFYPLHLLALYLLRCALAG